MKVSDGASAAIGKKIPAWPNTMEVFDHAGLLFNKPPSIAEVPFV
jgi:hypothetical protein